MWINRDEYDKLKSDSDKLHEKDDVMVIKEDEENWKADWEYANSECKRLDITIKQQDEKIHDLIVDLKAEKVAHQRTSNNLFNLKVDYTTKEKELESLKHKNEED